MASIKKQGFLFALVGLGLTIGFVSIASAQGRQSAIGNPQSAISLSVPFIQNQGQIADPQVRFYARTFGGTVYVTAEGELVYALPKAEEVRGQRSEVSRTTDAGQQTTDAGRRILNKQTSNIEHRTSNIECKNGQQTTEDNPQSEIGNRKSKILLIRETLVDADLTVMPSGAERSGAVINSFIGNDPRRWRANIPAFNGVQFGEIYEGIALEVRATGDNVEKIFTVAPGADPARIALRLAGAEGVSITPSGELEARTPLGPVRFTAPVAYQRSADGGRQDVSVAYALEGDQVGFCVGAFDAARPLVIDPLLASTFIGGTSTNVIRAMALDNRTNVLVAGYTASTDFPTTNTPLDAAYNGAPYDGFIAKFDPQLTNLLAATYLGGAGEDAIMAMGINSNNGAVYVAGYTASTNFPMTTNALYAAYRGGTYDAFVSVLNSNLAALTCSTYLGGTNTDKAYALALSAGPTQYVFVAGLTASTNFPITNTFGGVSFQTNLSRATGATVTNDAFMVRFDTNLSANLASTYLGGTNDDGAYGIALDTNNFVYVAGYTASTNFPVTNGYQMTRSGSNDVFVTRLFGDLTNVVASTYLGGLGNDVANGIAVAPFTNIVCVVGYTTSTNYPRNPTNNEIAAGYTNQFMGGKDAFLTRLNLGLTNILASTYLGGANDDEAAAVLTYATNNTSLRIYVAGWTTSTNFPVTTNAYDTTANGGRDAFVSYFGTGNTLRASTYLGGATNDSAYAMALQADHFSLFAAGATASTNFPATLRAYDNDRTGRTNDDGFVTKLGSGLAYGTPKWQVTLSDPGDDFALFISPSLGWDGTIYVGAGSNLYAYDANGNERWRFRANGRLHDDGGTYWGLGSTPVIARDGTIYFGTQNGYLYAVRDNGTNGTGLWTNLFSGQKIYSSPAIGNDGTLYFGANESPWPFYAVSSNGAVRWTNNVASSIIGSPAIDTNGRIYVASSVGVSNAILYMIDTNGTTLTNWFLANAGTASSPLIGSNGWVYIGSGTKLYGFNTAGSASQTWTAAGNILSSPAMDSNGVIYVGGGSNLYAFNTNGTTNLTWNTGGAVKSSPAIAEDGAIYVGSADTNLYAFSPDGLTNWVFPTTDYELNFQSPLLRRDGTIYFSNVRNLYAIFEESAVAQSSWPTYKHDVLRTGNAAFDAAEILKPTGLTASQGAYTNRVLVNWTGNTNADYYELWRGTNTNDLAAAALYQTLLSTNGVDTNVAPGLIYAYWVRVATPVAMSDFSDSTLGGAPPLPPTNVIASKGNPTNEIVITWSASSNATAYYLYNSQTNATNTAALLATTTTNVTGYTNSPPAITRGLTYYYWVQAGNGAAGISDFSAGTNGGTPPLAPTNITAGTNSGSAVDVAWSNATGADMYAVYRNTSTNIPDSFLGVAGVTNYSDTNATPLQDYYYWVRATNAYGMGEFSASAYGRRLLAPPQALHASRGDYFNKIRVTWQAELTATSYRIYRNDTSNAVTASNLSEIASSLTNYDDLIITRGTGYYYWVQSKTAAGTSDFSEAANGGTAPFSPLNILATDGTDDNPVTVTWNAAVYAAGYEVFRQDSYAPWSLTTPLDSAAGPVYSDVNARPGLRYYYWVKSTNQFGASELSAFDTGYRPLAPPYAISASDGVSADHLYVTWSVADNASSYELWRGTNSDSAAALALVNAVLTNEYDDTDSVPGVLYYYWVKAKTAQFVSGFSSYDSGYRALRQVDIGVSDLVFLPTRMAVVGAPAAVSFRVTNYGVQDMAAPDAWVACNFYISSNSVFGDADARWMGGTNVSIPLVVGNGAVVVLPKAVRDALAVPTVVPGWYYIFVNIQHAAPTKWLDPNLANNTISRNGGVIKIGASQPAGLILVNDYNGDGYTDLAMYQEATGTWAVWLFSPQGVTQGFTITGSGGVGFKAVPGDYDGDGKADLAVYKEATGTWEVWLASGDYVMASVDGWGGSGFEPVPSDYDGDAKADPAVYQESTGTWRVWLSASGYSMVSAPGLGGTSWQPVPGDYDGDGKADPAIYREQGGAWQVWRSSWQYAPVTLGGLGGSGYRPVVSDYDLDGIMDPAVFQASAGSWKILLSASGYAEVSVQGLGNTGTVAVPGDYDGDGLADPAVYWDSFGLWRLWLSSVDYRQTDVLAWPGDGFQPVWP